MSQSNVDRLTRELLEKEAEILSLLSRTLGTEDELDLGEAFHNAVDDFELVSLGSPKSFVKRPGDELEALLLERHLIEGQLANALEN